MALAPLLTIGGSLAIAGRYIARAQGDLDMYVLSGIGIAESIVVMPLFMGPRSPGVGHEAAAVGRLAVLA